MAAVTLEAAEACTLAVEDSTEEEALSTEVDIAAATMVDMAATTADIQEAATAVVGPMRAHVAATLVVGLMRVHMAVMVGRIALQLRIPGLGRVTAHATPRRDGTSFHPVMPAIWVAPEAQPPPRGQRHRKWQAVL